MALSEIVLILESKPADAGRLAEMIRSSFADVAHRFDLTPQNCPRHPSNYTRSWVEKDLARGVGYSILYADGTLVGCVGVERASESTCYMERLCVLPEHRGRGHGSRLARHAMAQARAMGASGVGIGIIAADTGLKNFYRALGFEAGQTQTFPHLPFEVVFMNIRL